LYRILVPGVNVLSFHLPDARLNNSAKAIVQPMPSSQAQRPASVNPTPSTSQRTASIWSSYPVPLKNSNLLNQKSTHNTLKLISVSSTSI
jgi:hypothetical protein